jgi:hypothetical protein
MAGTETKGGKVPARIDVVEANNACERPKGRNFREI